jgi:phosphatidylglycerophosphate synthase
MTWCKFKALAHPPDCAAAEFERGRLWRSTRWLGIRAAFVLSRLRVSANAASLIAVFLGVTAIGLLLYSAELPWWAGLIVTVCCWGSIFIDFCDGPLARAFGTTGTLGQILDGLGTDLLRTGLPVALGAASGSKVLLLAGVVSGFVLVFVRNQFIWNGIAFDMNIGAGALASVVRAAFSVVSMLGLLPVLIATASLFGLIRPVSCGVVILYALLALLWFSCACLRAAQAVPPAPSRQ